MVVIDTYTKRIELLDHAEPDYVMAICAENSDRFLDAVLLLAEFKLPFEGFEEDLSPEQNEANNIAACRRAEECAKVAGIGSEKNIYAVLLGCEIT